MDQVNERDSKPKRTTGETKQDGTKNPSDKDSDQHKDQWPPSTGPGERSDKDAIGRPVQLDQD
jgi:hypothetical protein